MEATITETIPVPEETVTITMTKTEAKYLLEFVNSTSDEKFFRFVRATNVEYIKGYTWNLFRALRKVLY